MTRLAVVGLASIGSRYAQWLAELLGAEVAVYDTDAQRLAHAVKDRTARGYDSFSHLLRDFRPGGVIVATPPDAHVDVAQDALRSGAQVLVEKPLAHDLLAARRLLQEAIARPGRLGVVCNMRFHPGPQAIRQHLPRLGNVLFARAHFGHRLSQMRPAGTAMGAYASSAARGGGAILDCIHEIDLQQWLLGRARLEHADCAQIGPDRIDAEDWAELVLSFAGGQRAALHLDLLQRHKRRGWEVVGTDGALCWSSEGRSPERLEVWFRSHDEKILLLAQEDVDDVAAYRQMLECFALGVDAGAIDPALQTPEEALAALEIALAARAGMPVAA